MQERKKETPKTPGRPTYSMKGIERIDILNTQIPDADIDGMSYPDLEKTLPRRGGTSRSLRHKALEEFEAIKKAAKPKRVKPPQIEITDLRQDFALTQFKHITNIKVEKLYIVGHGAAGNHNITGIDATGRHKPCSAEQFAEFINKNTTPPEPPAEMHFRISIIACHAGQKSPTQSSFARALFEALDAKFNKRGIKNIKLEVVARQAAVSRAQAGKSHRDQDYALVVVHRNEKGEIVEETPKDGAFPDLELKKINSAIDQATIEHERMSRQVRFPEAEVKLPAATQEEKKKARYTPTPIKPFSGESIVYLDLDGTITQVGGKQTFESAFFRSLLTASGELPPLDELTEILKEKFKNPENAKFKINHSIIENLEYLVTHGAKVCFLSQNFKTYIQALLLASGLKKELLNDDQVAIYGREDIALHGSKGILAEKIHAVSTVKRAVLLEDEQDKFDDIANRLRKSSNPALLHMDKVDTGRFTAAAGSLMEEFGRLMRTVNESKLHASVAPQSVQAAIGIGKFSAPTSAAAPAPVMTASDIIPQLKEKLAEFARVWPDVFIASAPHPAAQAGYKNLVPTYLELLTEAIQILEKPTLSAKDMRDINAIITGFESTSKNVQSYQDMQKLVAGLNDILERNLSSGFTR